MPTTLHARMLIALAGGVVASSVLHAQTPSSPTPAGRGSDGEPLVEGAGSSGRDFGGVLLPLPTQSGGVTLAARAGWTWTEDAPAAPTIDGERRTLGAQVQRVYLRGDVRIQIGVRRITASQAVAWVERIDEPTNPPEQAVYQVAVYLDRAANPLGGSGAGGSGDRLMVVGVTRGAFGLAIDAAPRQGRPQNTLGGALVAEGERRLARYLDRLDDPTLPDLGEQEARSARPDPNAKVSRYLPSLNRPYEPGSPFGPNGPRRPLTRVKNAPGLDLLGGVGGGSGDERLFSRANGVFTVAAGQPVLKLGQAEGEENRIVVTGGVVIQYSEPARDRALQLTAQNAVVFLAAGKLDEIARAPADKVLGIYLEGDVVATDGRFTLRAPHVFYDLRTNQAYTVDAVFWTYDERRGLPLYVRAEKVRQSTRNSVTAEGVTISASAFHDPLLTLGASSVTISREPDSAGVQRVMIDGEDFTPRLAGLPFFYVPGYDGELERFPLKDVRFENSSGSGFGVQTRWDVFGLTGLRPSDFVSDDLDLDVDLLVDAWFKRGVGIGTDVRWRSEENYGSVLGYWVPNDNGTDILSGGERRDRDGEGRGLALYEQRLNLEGGWTLFAEAATVSDPTFIDAYQEDLAETRREFASGINLRNVDQNSIFSLQARGNFDDFSGNEYILQSQGYNVAKLPEMRYAVIADDLLEETDPGTLLWTHEYRVGRVKMQFFKPTATDFGYPDIADSQAAFGLNPGESYEDFFDGLGWTDDAVTRGDTRQQVEWNHRAGVVNLKAWGVGRATYYGDDFVDFAGPENDEQLRWWVGGGARASTQAQRVYEGFSVASLDINQLRHIVEPSVTLFSAGTNRSNETLPLYDMDIEGAQEGTAWRYGLAQTFQTRRGAAAGSGGNVGRVVDLLRWNVDVVNGTSDLDKVNQGGEVRGIGRWLEYRPEESLFGNFVNTDAQLLLTDATWVIGGTTYDFDAHQPSRTTVGLLTEHGRDFKAYIELRYLNPLDATYLTFGGDYRLSSLYTLGLSAAYDTDETEIQDLGLRVNREFPDLTMTVRLRYNNITNETALGLVFTPLGRNRRLDNMRRLGRDSFMDPAEGLGRETDAAPR